MNPTLWLTQIEAALTTLENASRSEQLGSLNNASNQLGELTRHLAEMSPTARDQLQPHMARLLGRINAAAGRLGQTRQAAVGELKDLRQHGNALNAYMVSNFKNLPKK